MVDFREQSLSESVTVSVPHFLVEKILEASCFRHDWFYWLACLFDEICPICHLAAVCTFLKPQLWRGLLGRAACSKITHWWMFRLLTIHGSLFVMCSLVRVMLYLLLWCPQVFSVVVLMKLVVCSSVSLETRAFQQAWLLGANAASGLLV